MKKCNYIYAEGFRFVSGSLLVDLEYEDGVIRRFAVIHNGNGASRPDRFQVDPRADGATGEIILKDLAIRLGVVTTIAATYVTASGPVSLKLTPDHAMGHSGLEVSVLQMRESLTRMPPDVRAAFAEAQLYTLSYGTEDSRYAGYRLETVLGVSSDGVLSTAIARNATNFLKHYDWSLAKNLKQVRPLDFAAISIYAQTREAKFNGDAKKIREAHLGMQILDPDDVPDDVQLAAQLTMVEELTDQSLLGRIWRRRSVNESLRKAALVRLDDQPELATVALNDEDAEIRLLAVTNLRGQPTLFHVALHDPVAAVRLAAVGNINNPQRLKRLASGDATLGVVVDPEVALAALSRLTDSLSVKEVVDSPLVSPQVRLQAEAMLTSGQLVSVAEPSTPASPTVALNPDFHPEVVVDGVAVDQGISSLLAYFWSHDVRTAYSCQGGDQSGSAYISFVDGVSFQTAQPLLLALARDAGLTAVFGRSQYPSIDPSGDLTVVEVAGEWTVMQYARGARDGVTIYLPTADMAALNAASSLRL